MQPSQTPQPDVKPPRVSHFACLENKKNLLGLQASTKTFLSPLCEMQLCICLPPAPFRGTFHRGGVCVLAFDASSLVLLILDPQRVADFAWHL